jgi:adenylate kinase family enzyme
MVLKRLQEYDERTRPLVDWFQGRARFHRIDGDRDVNAIQADLRSRLRRTA